METTKELNKAESPSENSSHLNEPGGTASLPDPRPEIARRVGASSVNAVAKALRIPREQIARLAGGLPVRDGTLALARERLATRAALAAFLEERKS